MFGLTGESDCDGDEGKDVPSTAEDSEDADSKDEDSEDCEGNFNAAGVVIPVGVSRMFDADNGGF